MSGETQMTMSANHFLSSPTGRDPIDPAALGYMRQRNRGRVYSAVIDEFENSGISQVDLAGRLHKGTDQISRWLGSPGNWTLDTVSDLFFAISGGEPTYGVQYPLELVATTQTASNATSWIGYYEASSHDLLYASGTGSYVTGQTAMGIPPWNCSLSSVAVPLGVPYLMIYGSTTSFDQTTISGSNLSAPCVNCFNFGTNAQALVQPGTGSPVPLTTLPIAV
jgi:hypothetical protein